MFEQSRRIAETWMKKKTQINDSRGVNSGQTFRDNINRIFGLERLQSK